MLEYFVKPDILKYSSFFKFHVFYNTISDRSILKSQIEYLLKTHKQKKTKKRNEIKQKIRQDQKSFIWMAPKVLDYPPTNFSDASPAVACGRTHMQLSGKLVP